jgi:hypothetical protein
MSAQMTAPFAKEYGTEAPANAFAKLESGPDAAERDSKFQSSMQKLVSSLRMSDADSRDQKANKEVSEPLAMFAGGQMKDDTERVINHQGPAVLMASAPSAAPNPQATREMNALLKTEQTSKPIDNLNTNRFAANAENASQGAKNKGLQAERGADQLVKKANDIAAKMSPQEIAGMQPKGDRTMAEAGAHLVNPKLGAVLLTAHVIASIGQGQGTHSTEKTPSKPILSKSGERAMAKEPTRYYYDQAPQAIAAPAQPTSTQPASDKKDPGFDTGRLASQESLKDLKVGNIEKVVENSPAMKSIKSAGIDADNTKQALLDMRRKGLVADGGKQTFTPELQAIVKPTAPSPLSFRV